MKKGRILALMIFIFLLIVELLASSLKNSLLRLENADQTGLNSKELVTTSNDARGSTYSYYYISRRVWYIPLWFLVYFCVYILALIIRSMILHKVREFGLN